MLRASVLDRLCGPLCDAVDEQGGAAERLDALSRSNLFLVALDDRGEWYRFHHLFAQLLQVELEHREPGRAPELHRRAYEWHRDHGTADEAIHHALEAGAFAEAAELIAAVWIHYANECRYTTVLAWLRRFPDATLRANVRLLLIEAWVLSMSARREEAAQIIAEIEHLGGLDDGPLPDGFSSAEASLTMLHATFPWGDIGKRAPARAPGGRARANGFTLASRRLLGRRLWPLLSRRARRGRSLVRGVHRPRAGERAMAGRRVVARIPLAHRRRPRPLGRAAAVRRGGHRDGTRVPPRRGGRRDTARAGNVVGGAGEAPRGAATPRASARSAALLGAADRPREGAAPPSVGTSRRGRARAGGHRDRRGPIDPGCLPRSRCSAVGAARGARAVGEGGGEDRRWAN